MDFWYAVRTCVFTGKELDEETGYGYFGARYMDHELMTGWLSVDPMSDKYPSLSPYNYCAWNPIMLVDPDGRDWYKVKNSKGDYEYKWVKSFAETRTHKNDDGFQYLGKFYEEDGKYYSLFGGVYNTNSDDYKMAKCIDMACQNYAQRKINGDKALEDPVDFNFKKFKLSKNNKGIPTTTENILRYEFRSAKSSGIGSGEMVLLVNGVDMTSRFKANASGNYSTKLYGGSIVGDNFQGWIVKFGGIGTKYSDHNHALIVFKNENQYNAFFDTLKSLYQLETMP